ncbi:uncharacterized protein LOC114358448 [Ostrinia furnacalis]|uniref:uncharacterized protein LOC114358448 n=1 Tax=Ostrinia furnacalis TaxID=93504 RepID=UPI00103D2ED0|nr:uncharacterized protein LOC114358448 [Ostrinia furnacalis]
METQFQLLFDKMKLEMQQQSVEITESITNNIMSRLEEKLIPIIEENKSLKLKIETQEKEIEYLKREKRNNNIIIFGVDETEKTTLELMDMLKKTFKNDINIDIEDNAINNLYRLGKKSIEGNKPRPVFCSFVNGWKKNEIMKNKKHLKKIYVTEDYPKEILAKRKALQAELIEERKKGKIAFLKYDKLVVKETINEKRKRETSSSLLSSDLQPKKQQATASLANRTNVFDVMRMRSNSLTNAPTNKQQ